MYNGLTTADKPALLKEKENGGQYLVFNSRGFLVVDIDTAIAQIAEMEKNQVLSEIIDSIENPKPLTWNERINQMTARQRADLAPTIASVVERARRYANKRCRNRMWNAESMMSVYIEKFLHSPYTEGATK